MRVELCFVDDKTPNGRKKVLRKQTMKSAEKYFEEHKEKITKAYIRCWGEWHWNIKKRLK